MIRKKVMMGLKSGRWSKHALLSATVEDRSDWREMWVPKSAPHLGLGWSTSVRPLPPMSHRKTDLGIPCRSKSVKVVLI